MSEKPKRNYTREFKLEAIRLYESTNKSMSEVERELGITPYLLSKWCNSFARKRSRHFRHGKLSERDEELRRLRQEVEVLKQEREILKKGSGHLLTTKALRFAFIHAHRDQFPIQRMCSVMEVSTSGYYAWARPAGE